jgi:hypothetical protein
MGPEPALSIEGQLKQLELQLEKTRFRWLIISTSVVGLWTAGVFVFSYFEREKRAEADAELTTKIEDVQAQNAREQKQLDMLPSVLKLIESEKCESDLSAIVLLREMAQFRRSAEGIGDQTTRATIELMARRQGYAQARREIYCSCPALQFMAELVESGTDKATAQRAKELLDVAAVEGGPCAQEPRAQRALVQASRTFDVGADYLVILASDIDCESSRSEFVRVRKVLRRALDEEFKPELLKIVDGTHRGVDYRVLTYGDKVPLAQATAIVERLRGVSGIRHDTYWAKSARYRPSQCLPPG